MCAEVCVSSVWAGAPRQVHLIPAAAKSIASSRTHRPSAKAFVHDPECRLQGAEPTRESSAHVVNLCAFPSYYPPCTQISARASCLQQALSGSDRRRSRTVRRRRKTKAGMETQTPGRVLCRCRSSARSTRATRLQALRWEYGRVWCSLAHSMRRADTPTGAFSHSSEHCEAHSTFKDTERTVYNTSGKHRSLRNYVLVLVNEW